jgi:hypothetical protein
VVLLVVDWDGPLGLVVVVVSVLRSTALDPLEPAGPVVVAVWGAPAGAVVELRPPENNRKNPTNTIATSATMATEAPLRILNASSVTSLLVGEPEPGRGRSVYLRSSMKLISGSQSSRTSSLRMSPKSKIVIPRAAASG